MRLLLGLAGAIMLMLSCKYDVEEEKGANRPNIIIVFTDDQGYGDLGVYGSESIRTPHIDKLAREGLKFNQFYVPHPVCSASRAALLTGCYSGRVGIHNALMPEAKIGLHDDETTLAELLKENGYRTGIFGKWHLGHLPPFLPNRHGFDEYMGIPYSNDMWPNHPKQGLWFDFPPLPLIENDRIIDTLWDQTHLTRDLTVRAVDFIHRHHDKPFFLYFPHPMPHVPLYASERFQGKSPAGLYADVIEEIDDSVGQLVEALEKNGISGNTIIIFASDNGPWLSYGGHSGSAGVLREGKGTVFEGGVRIPFIMKWPDKIKDARVIESPAMTIDVLPTIADLLGFELPPLRIDGRSFSHLLSINSQYQPHQDAYFFYYLTNQLQAVLSGDGRWKMYLPHEYTSFAGKVGTADGLPTPYEQVKIELELYDLVNDISEQHNVIDQFPEVVESLLIHVARARIELGDKLTDSSGAGVRQNGSVADE